MFRFGKVTHTYLASTSPGLNVVWPQRRLASTSSGLNVVWPHCRWPQRRGLKVAWPQCPIGNHAIKIWLSIVEVASTSLNSLFKIQERDAWPCEEGRDRGAWPWPHRVPLHHLRREAEGNFFGVELNTGIVAGSCKAVRPKEELLVPLEGGRLCRGDNRGDRGRQGFLSDWVLISGKVTINDQKA